MPRNPYHNWRHVADVTQTAYALAVASGLMRAMPDRERLALLMAALCHDLEHPVPPLPAWRVAQSRRPHAAVGEEGRGLVCGRCAGVLAEGGLVRLHKDGARAIARGAFIALKLHSDAIARACLPCDLVPLQRTDIP